jgi:hypothetical protein
MSRGPSSRRRSRADKLGDSSVPSTINTETTEQTRPGPDLLSEAPVKTKGKSRVQKEPTAKFVHGLDAAGRLALLQQAFTGSPRAEPGLSKEQPMGGKSPSKRSRQKALSLDLATVPGSDSIIDPARLSEHCADNAVNTARVVPVLPTPVVDLSFNQAELTSGCQELSGGDSTAPTPRAVSKAELNTSKALVTVRRARSLTAAAPRKIPTALRL